mgnify:CR=1 FL=1
MNSVVLGYLLLNINWIIVVYCVYNTMNKKNKEIENTLITCFERFIKEQLMKEMFEKFNNYLIKKNGYALNVFKTLAEKERFTQEDFTTAIKEFANNCKKLREYEYPDLPKELFKEEGDTQETESKNSSKEESKSNS